MIERDSYKQVKGYLLFSLAVYPCKNTWGHMMGKHWFDERGRSYNQTYQIP